MKLFIQKMNYVKKNNKYYAPSGAEVEWLKEESYFFKLSEWQDKLIDYYKNNPSAHSAKIKI